MAINKEKVIAAAQKYVEKGQWDKAVKEYLKVTAEDPRDMRVLLRLGDTYVKKGDKSAATESYLRVAALYTEQGFFQKAIAVYKQVLKLDPRLVDVNFKLADLYKQLGLLSDAMQQYELASTFLHREGRVSEALEALRKMVELEPENVASRIKLAEAYSKESRVPEAVTEFTQAANFLRQTSRTDDFIKVAERLVFHDPENSAVQRELAHLYIRRNDPKRALPKLQQCFKADPRDDETLGLLARTFQQLGQLSKTISVLKELARIQGENGKSDERDATFRQILQLAPGDPEALAALGQPSGVIAAPSARTPLLTPAPARVATPIARDDSLDIEAEPSSPEMIEMEISAPMMEEPILEETTGVRGAHEPAEAAEPERSVSLLEVEVEPAADEEGADEEVVRILSETDVYIKYGLYDKALEHVRRVFEHDPQNLEAHEKLKEIYLALGDYHEAVNELTTAARLIAPVRPDDAVRYLREAVELEPDHEPAANLLRRLLSQLPGAGGGALPTSPSGAAGEEVAFEDESFGAELEVEVEPGGDFGAFPESEEPVEIEEIAEVEAFDDAGGEPPTGEIEVVDEPAANQEAFFEFDEDDDYVQAGAPPPAPAGGARGREAITAVPDEAPAAPQDVHDEEMTPVAPDTPFGDADASEPGLEYALDEPVEELIEEEVEVQRPQVLSGPPGYPRAAADEPTRAFDQAVAQSIIPGEITDDEQLLAMTAAPARVEERPAPPPERPVPPPERAAPPPERPAPPPERPAPPPPPSPARVAPPPERPATPAVRVAPPPERPAPPPPPPPAPPPPTPVAASADGSLEEELDEIDFFAQQALYNQAREMLTDVLGRYPNHPLVLAKLREIDEATGVVAPAPAAAAPPPPPPPPPAPPAPPPAAAAPPPPPPVRLPTPAPAMAASVASERPAQRGIQQQQQVDLKDFDTHYDLGIAYKEMGLFADAIREFELILEAPGKEVLCYTMIGLCYSAKGQQSEAISHFKKGLYVERISDQETISLYYELGMAYEKLNDPREALYYYEKVVKRDPRFRDVERRIAELRQQVAGPGPRGGGNGGNGGNAPSAEHDADVDAAFDGLLGPSGDGPRN